MLIRRYFRLRTLGRLTLGTVVGETESATSARPRHLAVLSVLALSPHPIPRDVLVEMFWGGETESRARHSLSNALSALRSLLGPEAISARRDHVSLSDEARLEVDALQFAAACECRDDERAASLYAGVFLSGIHVADAPEFDSWASRERGKLERQFIEVCDRLVPVLLASNRWTDAVQLAERWIDASPRSVAAFIAVLRGHAGPGTPPALANAIDAYEKLSIQLAERHDVVPAATILSFVDQLRDQLALSAHETAVVPALPVREQSIASIETPTRSRKVRSRGWTIGAVAAALLAILVWTTRRPATASAAANRPVVAVTTIDDVRGDSSISWLQAGLPRMIAADLDGMGGLEVVAPSRVRDVIVRLAGSSATRLSGDQAVDVARRLGAAWAVTGGVSAAKGGYLLDVTMRSVVNARETESFTILASDPIELGRMAATRLAALLDVGPGGTAPRYSGIETTSADAYRHFVRGALAEEAEQYSDAARELDAAILLDSGFVEAIRARRTVAAATGDTSVDRRLVSLERRYERRLPEIDRLSDEIRSADTLGERSRADALSLELVQRFSHDPAAYNVRVDWLTTHGRWPAAESLLVRELALDSLAMVAGDGPCTPCVVLWRLSQVRLAEGDRAGAEESACRWVALQPDLPAAWHNLSATLAATGKSAESVEAGFHMMVLSKSSLSAVDFGRTMLSARRYDIVDSLLLIWRRSSDPILQDGNRDLTEMLARERGQFAASVDLLSHLPATDGLILVRADGLARLGRLAEARALLEESGHPAGSSRTGQLTAPEARGFAWSHALEADALARAGDTTAARALADSIALAGAQSYYGRDKILNHHVLGMLDYARGDFVDAERELRSAEWGANAWTRTNVELARAQLAQRHYDDAIASLRDAYLAPVDAMARYVPRSELDWWMSRVFTAAGATDSAAKYARYVRAAWQHADPAVRARLDSLR